jgi:hypothetical protein
VQLNRAVDLAARKIRLDIEVGMHSKHFLPCDALVSAGLVTEPELALQVQDGRFDGQLCALPLRAV